MLVYEYFSLAYEHALFILSLYLSAKLISVEKLVLDILVQPSQA